MNAVAKMFRMSWVVILVIPSTWTSAADLMVSGDLTVESNVYVTGDVIVDTNVFWVVGATNAAGVSIGGAAMSGFLVNPRKSAIYVGTTGGGGHQRFSDGAQFVCGGAGLSCDRLLLRSHRDE